MPSFSRDRPPVLLLDVDGVLNAFDRVPAARGGWDDWQHGGATAEGTRWPITWSPRVVATLSDWHEQGRVELRWLTTWGHDANDELRRLLGLPELPVAGTYHEAGGPSGAAETGGGHASVTPAAPDPLSGSWWKYDVVVSLLRTEPERRFVWVDDYAFLEEQKISDSVPWVMLKGNDFGHMHVKNARARAAGLGFRPLEATVRDTLAWWATVPAARREKPRFSILPEQEAAALAAWRARPAR